jgi:hypothetical protein
MITPFACRSDSGAGDVANDVVDATVPALVTSSSFLQMHDVAYLLRRQTTVVKV